MDKAKRDAIERQIQRMSKLGGGRITPNEVLREAKSPKSPLHDQFEWDDSAAAHQFRLAQAREIIRSVSIEVTLHSRIVKTNFYMRDPAVGEKQGYVEVATLRTSKTLAREALQYEFERVQTFLERAHGLSVALGLSGEVAEIQQRVKMIHDRLDVAA